MLPARFSLGPMPIAGSGLLHSLLGIASFAALEGHPKLGASWEGFTLEEVLRVTGDREAYFWNTQGIAKTDLLVFLHGERFGFEFKYADAPALTNSVQVAREDLKLRQVFLVHPERKTYALTDWAEALSIGDLRKRIQPLMSTPKRRMRKRERNR